MNSFLDSNVIISYIFCLDSLFKVSKEIIFKSDNHYYSYHVKEEVNSVFSRKSFEFSKFLSDLKKEISHIDDNNFVSRSDFHKFIKDFSDIGKFRVKDMHTAFEIIWDLFNFGENQEVMIIKLNFDKFLKNFHGFNYSRKEAILNSLILVPNHTIKDQVILDKIKKENIRELLHESDEEILFDANEFCKNNPELNLKFVSADKDFLKAIDILMEYLCISESINVVEFSNN